MNASNHDSQAEELLEKFLANNVRHIDASLNFSLLILAYQNDPLALMNIR